MRIFWKTPSLEFLNITILHIVHILQIFCTNLQILHNFGHFAHSFSYFAQLCTIYHLLAFVPLAQPPDFLACFPSTFNVLPGKTYSHLKKSSQSCKYIWHFGKICLTINTHTFLASFWESVSHLGDPLISRSHFSSDFCIRVLRISQWETM